MFTTKMKAKKWYPNVHATSIFWKRDDSADWNVVKEVEDCIKEVEEHYEGKGITLVSEFAVLQPVNTNPTADARIMDLFAEMFKKDDPE